ncbi:hypothetical protein CGERO_08920 [Corynebacterium gerontici]|uniref:Uncharacterized protein n=1 Tax=Corynebacterium gerontici TaxID=2079234 RepID=A0A3G6J1Z8_9CORY|nr:hypothetical protein CGERO_08920 [Corynebacterium gerontici]
MLKCRKWMALLPGILFIIANPVLNLAFLG